MSSKKGFFNGGCFGDCFNDNTIWILIILIIIFCCFCGNDHGDC